MFDLLCKKCDSKESDTKANLDDSTNKNRNTVIFFLIFVAYSLVSTLSITDVQFLISTKGIILPLLGISIPLYWFAIIVPTLIFVLHFNILLNLIQHVSKLDKWIEEFNDKENINKTLSPFFVNFSRISSPNGLFKFVYFIAIYAFPIITLIIIFYQFATLHNLIISFIHLILIILNFLFLSIYYFKIQKKNEIFLIKVNNAKKSIKSFLKFIIYLWKNLSIIFKTLFIIILIYSITIILNFNFFLYFKIAPIISIAADDEIPLPNIEQYFKYKKLTDISNSGTGTITLDDIKNYNGPRVDLKNRNLNGANLSYARLPFANLSNSSIKYANLEGIQLPGAKIKNTNFTQTELKDTNFNESNLKGVNFTQANLNYATFKKANLLNVIFLGANSSAVDFQETFLSSANFQGTNLYYSNMQNSFISSTNFQGAYLYKNNLQGAIIFGSYFCNQDSLSTKNTLVINSKYNTIKEKKKIIYELKTHVKFLNNSEKNTQLMESIKRLESSTKCKTIKFKKLKHQLNNWENYIKKEGLKNKNIVDILIHNSNFLYLNINIAKMKLKIKENNLKIYQLKNNIKIKNNNKIKNSISIYETISRIYNHWGKKYYDIDYKNKINKAIKDNKEILKIYQKELEEQKELKKTKTK